MLRVHFPTEESLFRVKRDLTVEMLRFDQHDNEETLARLVYY